MKNKSKITQPVFRHVAHSKNKRACEASGAIIGYRKPYVRYTVFDGEDHEDFYLHPGVWPAFYARDIAHRESNGGGLQPSALADHIVEHLDKKDSPFENALHAEFFLMHAPEGDARHEVQAALNRYNARHAR